MNKNELLVKLEIQREVFLDELENIPEDAWLEPGVVGNWSIKDILAHISRWEAEIVKLMWQVQHGIKPSSIHFEQDPIPVNIINDQWYKESQDRPLEKVLEDFHTVRNQTILRVEAFSENDFNEPKKNKVLKRKPLWEWIANDSFGHEEEHLDDIVRWKKIKGY